MALLSGGLGKTTPRNLTIVNINFLAWKGVPIALYGASNYWITGDPDVVITTLFDEFQAHGSNLHRCSVQSHVVGKRSGLSQTDVIYPFDRSGTAGANDGGNKFDLTALNSAYFSRLGTIAKEAFDRDIIDLLIMWDEIPFKTGTARWEFNPFNDDNNINTTGLDAVDAINTGGKEYWKDAAESATTLRLAQDLLFDAVLDEFAPYGNLLVAIGNEYSGTDAWHQGWNTRVADYNVTNSTNFLTLGMKWNSFNPTWTDIWSPETSDPATSANSWKASQLVVSHKIPGAEKWFDFPGAATAHWWNSFIYGAAGEGDDSQDGGDPPMQWTQVGAAATALDLIKIFHDTINTVPFNLMTPEDQSTVIGTSVPWRYSLDSVYMSFDEGGSTTESVDLSATTGTYTVTWYNVETGASETESNRSAMGASEAFTGPYAGVDTVLVLRKQ